MRKEEKLTDFKFFNVYKIVDPSRHLKNYLYGERRGKDSVAFVCYDPNKGKFLLNKEFKPPVDEFIVGGFGGSIDKDKGLRDIVRDEVKEEAGYTVSPRNILYLGRVLVSTQMNQFCYLYLVLISDRQKTGREPENAVEAMATPVWYTYQEVLNAEDWKPITIVQKAIGKGVLSAFTKPAFG